MSKARIRLPALRVEARDGVHAVESRVVERVVEFAAELNPPGRVAPPLHVLEQGKIPIMDAWPANGVFGRVADPEVRPFRRPRHLPAEVPVDAALALGTVENQA